MSISRSSYPLIKEELLNYEKLSQKQQKEIQKKRYPQHLVNESTQTNPDNIIPELIPVDSKHKDWKVWKSIEEHVASFVFRRSPGRNLYYLIKNKVDNKNLGIIDVAADFLSLGPRDEHIGWSVQQRKKMNRNIANISICVPTRFFGYNMAGGKLLTLLAASNEVADRWKDKYGDELAGLTVTSLYGKSIQYNRLEYFHYLGKTQGQGTVHIPNDLYKKMRAVVENEEGEIPGGRFTKGKNSRINIIRRACKYLDVNPALLTTHGQRRGIYWCDRYINTPEWLSGKVDTLIKRKNMDVDSLTELWRYKYAYRRVENLKKRGEFPRYEIA